MKVNIRQFAQNCHSRFHIRVIKEKLSYQNLFIYRNRQNTIRNLSIMGSELAIKTLGRLQRKWWRGALYLHYDVRETKNNFTPCLVSNKLLLVFWFPLGNDLCYTSQDLFLAPYRIPPVTCYFPSFIASWTK